MTGNCLAFYAYNFLWNIQIAQQYNKYNLLDYWCSLSYHCIKIWIVVSSSKLKEATVWDTYEKGLCIGTKRHSCYLTEEINFLFHHISTFYIENVHKIFILCHSHISAIRRVANWHNRSKCIVQHSDWLGQVPDIPYSACVILIPSCKCLAIRMPRWCIRGVHMSRQRRNNLLKMDFVSQPLVILIIRSAVHLRCPNIPLHSWSQPTFLRDHPQL